MRDPSKQFNDLPKHTRKKVHGLLIQVRINTIRALQRHNEAAHDTFLRRSNEWIASLEEQLDRWKDEDTPTP